MENEYEINDDELHLKCDDGYFKLNEKMTCLWRYLSRVKEYNRYLKIDDDTFMNIPKLKDYLSEIISREINYFGAYNGPMKNYTMGDLPSYDPYYEGGFYGMSKEIIDYYVEHITNESIISNRFEDKLFADTVRDNYRVINHFAKESIEISKNINFICFEDRNKNYSNQTIIHNIKDLDDFLYISQLKEEITELINIDHNKIFKNTILICRIIGNDIPDLHGNNQTIEKIFFLHLRMRQIFLKQIRYIY